MVEHLKKKKPIENTKEKEDNEEFVDYIPDIRDGFQPLFAFISDPHINAHQYNLPQRAEDMLDALRGALIKCKEILGDDGLVVIGGDMFNSSIVSPSALMKTTEVINDAGCGMKIISIRGNHDGSYTKAQRKNISLIPLQAMTDNFKYVESGCDNWLLRGELFIFQSHDKKTMKKLWEMNQEIKEGSQGCDHKILVLHSIVEGSVPFGWDIPREEFKTFLREHNIDLILTGHLHTKFVDNELNLLNPGSLECLDIDQAGNERGFFIIGMENGVLSHQWIPVRTRPMKDIVIDVGDISEVDLNDIVREKISGMNIPKGAIARFNVIGSTTKSLRRIDKKLFTAKFPHLLKIFINNRIKYIQEGEDVVELLSPKDAIKKALKDAGIRDRDLDYFSESMIDISNEASKRVEGWQNEIRKIIQRQIKG